RRALPFALPADASVSPRESSGPDPLQESREGAWRFTRRRTLEAGKRAAARAVARARGRSRLLEPHARRAGRAAVPRGLAYLPPAAADHRARRGCRQLPRET